ncbi:DNA protecting protein DprA [Shewanella sp. NFH-SH190041]|nr:DNA protecting protein DprA [Shewanella sp. NFH-SH190041]
MTLTAPLIDWVTIASASGIGAAGVQRLLQVMDVEELSQRLRFEPDTLPGVNVKRLMLRPARVEQALQWRDASEQHHLIAFDDLYYPPLLRHIYDPPVLLFAKGDHTQLLRPAIAVVGSRSASRNGLDIATSLSQELSLCGLAICSGMASGIDGAAHQGALVNSGVTLAVLGTGVDQCYPARHRQLYQNIAERGCLLSEFWPGTKPVAANFPKRNRIISGISVGTLVVEAQLKSGSLITARLASEQGREVFSVPGGILSGQSRGCHELLKNGAKLVENVSDITEEISPLCGLHLEDLPQQHHIKGDNACELPFLPLLASVNYEVTTLDEVVEHSGKTIDLVLEQILELELQGWVAAVPGGYVRLKRN